MPIIGNFNGNPGSEVNRRLIRDETGRNHNDFVPRIDGRRQRQEKRLGAADRDDNLVVGVITNAVKIEKMIRDRGSQPGNPKIRGIVKNPWRARKLCSLARLTK